MKFTPLIALAAIAQGVNAHYIWDTLIAGSTTSRNAVRQPANNSPVEDVTSAAVRCNSPQSSAPETVTVTPGSTIGFKLDNTLYHTGPAALYIAKAPGSVASWDGSGSNWIKIAEWGATFNPFQFTPDGQSQLTTTLPNVPAGEYLVRIEHIGLHVAGSPQFYISCAQISVPSGSGSLLGGVSIPGYIQANDPSITLNIYYPVPTSYVVPGPAVWRG